MNFLRELKEEGPIVTDWILGKSNPSNLFTKNLAGPAFEKHTVGMDQYIWILLSVRFLTHKTHREGVAGHYTSMCVTVSSGITHNVQQ
jgi:hypothetical protein